MQNLKSYKQKRDFSKTKEPKGSVLNSKHHRFCVQHHIARKDHYDFRLEMDGVLLSWAVPKGPSYDTKIKRLAVHVENHPLTYRNFEGTIPKGEYGAGTVMLWDRGTYKEIEPFSKTYKKGYLKFELLGKRLKGNWFLTHFKEDNWLLIKEKDVISLYDDIAEYETSIKTGRTMDEIGKNQQKIKLPKITNPDKILYKETKTTKREVYNYYNKVKERMLPYLKNRLLSTVRAPSGTEYTFFKKHFPENIYLKSVRQKNKNNSFDKFYYIIDEMGLLTEVQMNGIEFHIGGSSIKAPNNPNIMVFDLDPDENLSIEKVREGVKDLKSILDELKLPSFLKTSGGKGYHIVTLITSKITWNKFEKIARDIAKLMEQKYPLKYTTNIRKENRHGKIFIDYFRNKKSATSVAPYSLRARSKPTVSMPIKWSELDKIKPDDITIKDAIKRLKRKDPWEDLYKFL